MATRHSQDLMELKSVDVQECISHSQFMLPPSGWGFNNLIANICQELHERDLDAIKRRFQGVIHEDVRTWKEAFDMLMVKRYVTQDNLIYLQVIIRVLGRADLLATTIEYANRRKRMVLHFYETTTEIRPGHRWLRIHVKGRMCQTGDHLDAIRITISEILWVPLEDIVVAGIEEGDSVYITFTLPAIYVATLQKFLENETRRHILKPLGQLGIDKITIAEDSFELDSGEETQKSNKTSDKKEIIQKLQLELYQKECQMGQLETKILKYRRYKLQHKSSGVQTTRKRKPFSNLKGSKNKRIKTDVKREKVLQLFENETENKQGRHPQNSSSSLKKYDTSIKEKNVILRKTKFADRKMQQLAYINMSVRKNTFMLYGSTGKPFPTLEEINAQSLYTKINRVYPVIEDPRKNTKK